MIPLILLPLLLLFLPVHGHPTPRAQEPITVHAGKPSVLILGGGVSGVIAARTLHRRGISDFLIVEARRELGGRMQSHVMGGGWTVEAGANWIQGARNPALAEGKGDGDGVNPIYELAVKHGIRAEVNDFEKSFSTFDENGEVDYRDVVWRAVDDYERLSAVGVRRYNEGMVDLSSRAGYSLVGARPRDKYEAVAEYFQFDLEFAQTPEGVSWIAQSMNDNFTYEGATSGFTDDGDLLAIDPRGFKTLIQSEAAEFLDPSHVLFDALVTDVEYSDGGVNVTLRDGRRLSAKYALCTFSLGVLQGDDVRFQPELPAYKQEALQSMTMSTYTKIFFKFKTKFWFNTEMALYASPERGHYPIWQSLDHPNFLPGSGIVFVTMTGAQALRAEALPDDQVKAEALQVLRNMFPHSRHRNQEPEDFFFHRWHADPLFRGSYSNWPASFVPEHHMNVRANLGNLYFGGEATSLKYYGFLHGAYHEGREMADFIAECVESEGTRCVQLPREDRVRRLQK